MTIITIICVFLGYGNVYSKINAGFINGLWYSKYPFFSGDKIRIYSALQNQSEFDLTGKIQFIIDDNVVGSSVFNVMSGRLIESWADWTATKGKRKIYIKVIDAYKIEIGQEPIPVEITFSESGVITEIVDSDNDGDGIGDMKDYDDDNDGLLDKFEEEMKTDTLKSDTDNDGVSDYQEVKEGTDPLIKQVTSTNTNINKDPLSSQINTNTLFINEQESTIKQKILNLPQTASQYLNSLSNSLNSNDQAQNLTSSSKKQNIDWDEVKENPSSILSIILDYLISIFIFIIDNIIVLIVVLLLLTYCTYKLIKYLYKGMKER